MFLLFLFPILFYHSIRLIYHCFAALLSLFAYPFRRIKYYGIIRVDNIMNNTKLIFSSAILFLCLGMACKDEKPSMKILSEVSFTEVELTDDFWSPRIEVNRTVSIPSAFHQCEINGRFDNFALAGGLIEGEYQGDFSFDDTDSYKIIEGASYSLAVRYDPQLDAYLDSVIILIGAAQEPDGYLTTCVTNR